MVGKAREYQLDADEETSHVLLGSLVECPVIIYQIFLSLLMCKKAILAVTISNE